MNKKMRIPFSSALLNIVEHNSSFDAAKLRIAYTGKNRNNTFISKESFEQAIPTMFNCPVVANYMREENEIGSHDGEFIKDNQGEVKYVNVTQPVGVVPESAQWNWEEVDDDGVMHQYLCTDVLLWKRQEAYDKIKTNGITKQSMEIEVSDGQMLDDYYDIKRFTFTAFCLLGTAEPCFESASLFTFSEEESVEFKEQYTQMMKEFKLAFSDVSESAEQEQETEVYNRMLKELLNKYSVTLEDLEFEVQGMTDEELVAKFAEVFEDEGSEEFEGDPEVEPVADPKEDPEDQPAEKPEETPGEGEDFSTKPDAEPVEEPIKNTNEFALNSQMREELRSAVCGMETIESEWGSYGRYFMVDFDEAAGEVYFIDETDWNLYGCGYSLNGDSVSLASEDIKRKRYAIVDFVEGTEDYSLQVISEKYRSVSADKKEFERLKQFEIEILGKQRAEAEAELFEQFEDELKENKEFEALKANASQYTLEALEKELFALKGKMDFSAQKEKASKATPGIVFEEHEDEDPMRKLFAWKKNEK